MALIVSVAAGPELLHAQITSADSAVVPAMIARAVPTAKDSARTGHRRYLQLMGYGFATSILAHESGHALAAYAMGLHPHFGISAGRPTIYSGVNELLYKHKQFVFSAAGLTVQELLDELVLDIPHRRGSAFERGILAGGIGTTLFYATIGRNGSVSDVAVMARTSHLSKTRISLMFGSVSALHTVRMVRNHHYARFFAGPSTSGMKFGVTIGQR